MTQATLFTPDQVPVQEVLDHRLRQALAPYLGAPYEIRTLEAMVGTAMEATLCVLGDRYCETHKPRVHVLPDKEGRISSEITVEWVARDPKTAPVSVIGPIHPFAADPCG